MLLVTVATVLVPPLVPRVINMTRVVAFQVIEDLVVGTPLKTALPPDTYPVEPRLTVPRLKVQVAEVTVTESLEVPPLTSVTVTSLSTLRAWFDPSPDQDVQKLDTFMASLKPMEKVSPATSRPKVPAPVVVKAVTVGGVVSSVIVLSVLVDTALRLVAASVAAPARYWR